MEIKEASRLLEANIHTIFAWCVSRLYEKQEAEDLAQDIICEVLKSVHRLQKEEAFYGYLWRTADHVFAARLRRLRSDAGWRNPGNADLYDDSGFMSPEEEMLRAEQIRLLRRELAFLSNQYREVTIRYYFEKKSCAEIARELGLSVEMVKYYLFKTRKKLKEGIDMKREFGEKSYHPAAFTPNYWGQGPNTYSALLERKLPGNILLCAYEKPVTAGELSAELGVASVYLEDELDILEQNDIIRKTGDKYQTNIIIFTEGFEKSINRVIRPVYEEAAGEFHRELQKVLPQIRKLDFHGKNFDDNRLKWAAANIALYHARGEADDAGRRKYGGYPLLSNGTRGFVFGHGNDSSAHPFHGVYGYQENAEKTVWISIENYRIIEECQNLRFPAHLWQRAVNALGDAALYREADRDDEILMELMDEGVISCENGRLSPEFPVFSKEAFDRLKDMLSPVTEQAAGCMTRICDMAGEILKKHTPALLQDKCGQLAYIRYHLESMAFLMETMAERGQLVVPDEKMGLCVFGVKMG